MNKFRRNMGLMIWGFLLLFIATSMVFFGKNNWVRAFRSVSVYLSNPRQTVDVVFDIPLYVKRGDPVFVETENGLKRIGQISYDEYDDLGLKRLEKTRVTFFGSAPPVTNDCYLTMHETPLTFEWAVNRLFPDEKKKAILARFQTLFEQHREDILAGFQPILLDAFQEAKSVLQQDLKLIMAEYREQLLGIANRYQKEFVEKSLVPLVKEEIWPIIESRATPILNDVGSDIWNRASLFRFGWRFAYDKFPLTKSNLTQKEWNRFVKEEAVPVIQDYSDEFYAAARLIIRDVSENTKVKGAIKEGVNQLLNDDEIKSLLRELVMKLFVQNQRLKDVVSKHLSSQRTVNLFRETTSRFEDELREIGDEVFGTFDKGITVEFAGVLRKEILRRDHRWFILRYRENTPEGVDPLAPASEIQARFSMDQQPRPEFVRSND